MECEGKGKVTSMCEVAERLKQQGREEGHMEVARQLLDVLDVKTIAEKTGLPIEVVQSFE